MEVGAQVTGLNERNFNALRHSGATIRLSTMRLDLPNQNRVASSRLQGDRPSPLSPIVVHYAYSDVWQALAKIAKTHDLTLTVYIDADELRAACK
jgi:hypothetical protein